MDIYRRYEGASGPATSRGSTDWVSGVGPDGGVIDGRVAGKRARLKREPRGNAPSPPGRARMAGAAGGSIDRRRAPPQNARVKRPLLALLAFVAACGGNVVVDEPGSSSTGGQGGATTSCGSVHVFTTPTCESCAQLDCCSQLLACDQGTPCGVLLGCFVLCPPNDSACENACTQTTPSPGGVNDLQALSACLMVCVSPACSNPTPAVCDSGLQAPSTSCGNCLTIECCAEAEKCEGSASCHECFVSGPNPPACDPAYAVLDECRATRCGKVCP
jgi:hypothetical protein